MIFGIFVAGEEANKFWGEGNYLDFLEHKESGTAHGTYIRW